MSGVLVSAILKSLILQPKQPIILLSLMLEHTAPKQIPPTSTTSLQNYSQDKQRAIENYSKLGTQHLYLSPSRALAAAKLLAE